MDAALEELQLPPNIEGPVRQVRPGVQARRQLVVGWSQPEMILLQNEEVPWPQNGRSRVSGLELQLPSKLTTRTWRHLDFRRAVKWVLWPHLDVFLLGTQGHLGFSPLGSS
jgi:hypothetical protein